MNVAPWAANTLGWPAIQLAIGGVAVRLPRDMFAHDTWLTAPRTWEGDGRIYRDVLAIRRWKRLLPDRAPWIGGLPKHGLLTRDPAQVALFLVETRRAEIAHWCMVGCLPLFLLWNPWWARVVMTAYAIVTNGPCILAQRYNRLVLSRFARNLSRIAAH